jgi:hypothetical protein
MFVSDQKQLRFLHHGSQEMARAAKLPLEFARGINSRIDLSAEPVLRLIKGGNDIGKRGFANHQEVNVTALCFFSSCDGPMDKCHIDLVTERGERSFQDLTYSDRFGYKTL